MCKSQENLSKSSFSNYLMCILKTWCHLSEKRKVSAIFLGTLILLGDSTRLIELQYDLTPSLLTPRYLTLGEKKEVVGTKITVGMFRRGS